MLECLGVDQKGVGALSVRDGPHVREIDLLCSTKIVQKTAGRRGGRRASLEAEPGEPGRAELVEEGAAGCLFIERPRLNRRDGKAGGGQGRPPGCDSLA